jgi:hypothetical protein
MRFMHLMRPLARFRRAPPPSPPALDTRVPALDQAPLGAPAVRSLPDGEVLRALAGLHGGASAAAANVPANLERIAQQRLAHLIDSGATDFVALRTPAVNMTALLSVAGLCRDPAHLSATLAAIDDPRWMARLVIEGSTSRLRQLAAHSIENPGELVGLLRQVRSKDKSVYKILKQKSDALRSEEQRTAQCERDVAALCESIERHSRRVHDALYVPSFEHFEARWRTLEALSTPEIRDRTRQAIDRCREVIDGHLRQAALRQAQASQEPAGLRAAREEALAHADAESERRAESAAASAAAAAEAAAAAAELRQAEQRERTAHRAAEALAVRQIRGLIGKTESALRDGQTGRAAALRRALEERLPTLPVAPGALARRVLKLDAQLDRLKAWKDYAVAPKRAGLIEAMEALIGSSESPPVLADRIKRLQQEWKTISKGIVSDSEADWQRFHQASQTAYQPCRDHFEAQARLRKENLEQRRSVLERLRAFETAQSGDAADFQAVAAVLREAPQEWRRRSPVDRAEGAILQEEFDAALDRLRGRLDVWHAKNAAEKTALIQRAQHLLAQADSRETADAVKRLQLLWKQVGPARRDQEQLLWNAFRQHCDAVFHRRQQALADHAAGLEANKTQAAALCEEVELLAALSGPALLTGAGKLAELRTAFEALNAMPRIDVRALHARFERAVQLFETRTAEQRAYEQKQSFTHLLEATRRIQAFGWALAQAGPSVECDLLRQSAETFIAGIAQWPKGGPQSLKDAWDKAHAAAGLDRLAHETALRTLCVRSEILTDRPTPPEDQALRRDYQVKRLMQKGQHEQVTDTLDAMVLEWVRVGPVPAETHESLLARFLRCR